MHGIYQLHSLLAVDVFYCVQPALWQVALAVFVLAMLADVYAQLLQHVFYALLPLF